MSWISKKILKKSLFRKFNFKKNYNKKYELNDVDKEYQNFYLSNNYNDINTVIRYWIDNFKRKQYNDLVNNKAFINKIFEFIDNKYYSIEFLELLIIITKSINIFDINDIWDRLFDDLPNIINYNNSDDIFKILANIIHDKNYSEIYLLKIINNEFIYNNLYINSQDNEELIKSKLYLTTSLIQNEILLDLNKEYYIKIEIIILKLQDIAFTNINNFEIEKIILKILNKFFYFIEIEIKNYHCFLQYLLDNLQNSNFKSKIKIINFYSIYIDDEIINKIFFNNINLKNIINKEIDKFKDGDLEDKKLIEYLFSLYNNTYKIYNQENIEFVIKLFLKKYHFINENCTIDIVNCLEWNFNELLINSYDKDKVDILNNYILGYLKIIMKIIVNNLSYKILESFLILIYKLLLNLSEDVLNTYKTIIKNNLNFEDFIIDIENNNFDKINFRKVLWKYECLEFLF